MAEDRTKIPTPLRREVLEEAGYACAIPVCRIATVEIAHIEPWSKVKEHTFDNLIALCPNHHTLYDVEKKIPKASVLRYKANLAVLNGRYSDLERRVLEDAVAQRYGMANGMPVPPDPGMRQWTVHRGWACSSLIYSRMVSFARVSDRAVASGSVTKRWSTRTS